MTGCRELFEESGLSGRDLQDAVEAQFPDGQCELTSVSRWSPGPVIDPELLTRLVFHPIHVDERGQPNSQAVSDLVERDLSVFREQHASDEELARVTGALVERGRSRQPPQRRRLVLTMTASAKALRALRTDPSQARLLRIYDTARQETPSHASLFVTAEARKTMGKRAILRRTLELFLSAEVEDGARYRNGTASSWDRAAPAPAEAADHGSDPVTDGPNRAPAPGGEPQT